LIGIGVVSGRVLVRGIIVVIVFAALNADALPADGDALLARTRVEGRTDDKDRGCNQQRGQLNEKRHAQSTLRMDDVANWLGVLCSYKQCRDRGVNTPTEQIAQPSRVAKGAAPY